MLNSSIKTIVKLSLFSSKLNNIEVKNQVLKMINNKIYSGPFKGMKYINRSSGSALVPKLTGTYECELHDVINKIIKDKYTLIIDVGAAEGYYAVGLSYVNRHRSDFKVLAYDTDTEAINNLHELAKLNSVSGLIETHSLFSLGDLKKYSSENIFLICDIEGAEKELLNPSEESALLNCDILVEIHDGEDSNEIKELLRKRFEQTHTIEHIKFDESHKYRHNIFNWIRNSKAKQYMSNEGRKYGLDWFYMVRKNK